MSYEKTKAIVLHKFPYLDSGLIVHLYTEKYGRLSTMVKGIKGAKGRNKIALLQQLNLLELELIYKEKRNLQSIREFRLMRYFGGLDGNMAKQSIALFLAEVLYRSLREEEQNQMLYSFLENSLLFLDETSQPIANFHLVFLFQYSKFLGIFPHELHYTPQSYFDLMEGNYAPQKPLHPHYLQPQTAEKFLKLGQLSFSNMETLILSRSQRNLLIQGLLDYYQLHIESFGQVKSFEILSSLYDS